MANQSLNMLAVLCVASSLIYVTHEAGSIGFTFPPLTGLQTEGNAYLFQGNKLIQLSPSKRQSSGWVVCNKSIPLWDDSSPSLANFTTHFRFIISGGGDGLAFFLAPLNLHPPKQNEVQWFGAVFGLFTSADYPKSPYPIVAVEFDTYKNPQWDPDDNHVGIDVSSYVSMVNVSFRKSSVANRPVEYDLKNGKNWDVWIDYDGGATQLRVFLSYNPNLTDFSKPRTPILTYDIDLRRALPKNVKVGLSSATGTSVGNNTVSFWKFSSQYSWEISTENRVTTGKRNSMSSVLKAILISVCACFLAACAMIFLGRRWYANSRRIERSGEESEGSDGAVLEDGFLHGPRKFSFAELLDGTRNFRILSISGPFLQTNYP